MSIDKIKEQLSHKYEFIELIGKGGFAEVYRAKDKMLEREVAIKILSGQYSRVALVILAVLLSKKKDSETVAQAYELPFTNNLTKEITASTVVPNGNWALIFHNRGRLAGSLESWFIKIYYRY